MLSAQKNDINIAKLFLTHPNIDLKIRDFNRYSIFDYTISNEHSSGPIDGKLNWEFIKNSKTRKLYLRSRIIFVLVLSLASIAFGASVAQKEEKRSGTLSIFECIGTAWLCFVTIFLLTDTGCAGVF